MLGNICRDRLCEKRHRLICKYEDRNSGCTRGSDCMFWHKNELKKSTFKCDTCMFAYGKNQVNTLEIHEQKFLRCQKCDKILEHKEILLTKGSVILH